MKSKIFYRCLLAVVFAGGAFWFSHIYQKNWSWPISLLFGAITVFVFVNLSRLTAGKPPPFQLVLRLSNDDGGDQEDGQTIDTLHARFKQHFRRSSDIRFKGFDTDGSFIWFYFVGPEEAPVRQAVMSQFEGCRIRPGSYFLSKATQTFAPSNDGPVTPLGDSGPSNPSHSPAY